ncbi:hypothetical protein DQG23_38915 [Paenibacillus contaminans]|uniref:Uncharacterized protein n=1 Tax=Paenibacillus contaminans TaxID=450362 RepID=A0A329LRF8_9BACL|nr:hypothetical protein DQG23_38915 [Paenibacillus contaminans]
MSLTLESDFADLENGFTGVTSKKAAASRRFRTRCRERKPYSIPSGQIRTARYIEPQSRRKAVLKISELYVVH